MRLVIFSGSETCSKRETYDLSIASTKTKYIKLNPKTQNIFCRLNENFLIHFDRGNKKTKGEKKVFSIKVYTKVKCYFKKWGFSI
jgi:hypothetical protein